MELLRFSVWKKELIEKQQTLYKLLRQTNNKEPLEIGDGEILHNESDDDDYSTLASTLDDISSEELNDLQRHRDEDITDISHSTSGSEVEDEPDEPLTSEHEPDSDFELSLHHKRGQNKPMILDDNDEDDIPPNKKDLRCRICNTTFLARQGLVRHEAFCKPNKLAGRKTPLKKARIKNMDKDAKFRCFCNERFTSFRALNIHRTRKHGKNSNMSWDIIGEDENLNGKATSSVKAGHSSKSSDKVKSSPTKKIEQTFKCSQCPYTSNEKRILKYHIRANHEDAKIEPKLECDECFKLFSTTASLRMHIVTVHHDVRP